MNRQRLLQAGFALVAISIMAASDVAAREASGKPSILIIVTDDQGYADLSAFEHHAADVETPNMDRLAARGVLFTEAYASAPVCSPSRAGWNTGRHQVRWDPKSSFNCGLPKDVPHIAEIMKATDNRPLRSYKGDIYEGGIRVPCIIDWPGVTKSGSVSDVPIHGTDFYATLLAMTGLPQQPENHQDSVNLVPLLKGDADFKRRPMIWHYPVGVPHIAHSKPGSVIRDGDWKFLRFYEDGREELYNLKKDIGESKNLVASMPKKATEMKTKLDAVLKAHDATIPTAVPPKSTRPKQKKVSEPK